MFKFIFKVQSVFNYVLLSLVFIPIWLIKNKYNKRVKEVFKKEWWKYFLVSLADVEANYFMVKAYSLTLVTTIQVS